jgi:hypothetical protein
MPTRHGIGPAALTTPIPRVDDGLQLSAQTLAWLAEHPHARRLVRSVWDALTKLEQAGHHPKLIDALRRVLTWHQPTRAGRCRACRRGLRRRPFPCVVWHQIRSELVEQPPTARR